MLFFISSREKWIQGAFALQIKKSLSSCCHIWFSFVTGVWINFNPPESNLVWFGVNWKSMRFLMSFAILCFFYILILHAESSPLIVFLVLKFALPCKLSPLNVIRRHRKQAGLRFNGFLLNVFHLWQFLHHRINLDDLFLDIIFQLAYIFLCVAFASVNKRFILGLVENSFRSIRSMSSGVFLCFSELFLVFLLLVYNCEVKGICFPRRPPLLKSRKKICNEIIIVLQVKIKRKKKTSCISTTRWN